MREISQIRRQSHYKEQKKVRWCQCMPIYAKILKTQETKMQNFPRWPCHIARKVYLGTKELEPYNIKKQKQKKLALISIKPPKLQRQSHCNSSQFTDRNLAVPWTESTNMTCTKELWNLSKQKIIKTFCVTTTTKVIRLTRNILKIILGI